MAGGLVALTLLVFGQVTGFSFVGLDDNLNVFANPHLSPLTARNLGFFWMHPYEGLYIPVVYTAFALLAKISLLPHAIDAVSGFKTNFNPHVFHTGVLLVHTANVLLVFAILRLLSRHDLAAFLGAALFAFHPVQSEPVSWVTGLKDVLCGFWELLCLWLYVKFAQGSRDGEPGARQRGFYIAACVCYLLALLSKPSAAVIPLAAWAIDRWAIGRSARLCTVALAGWLVVAVPLFFKNNDAQSLMESTTAAPSPFAQRPLIAGDSLAFYLSKLVWPAKLCIDYGRTPDSVMASGKAYWDWIFPVGVAGLVIWIGRRYPTLLAAGAIFVAAVLPVLGLADFAFQEISTVGDRYLYLSMLGPALAVTVLVRKFPGIPVVSACAVCLLILGGRCALQTRYWRNSDLLFHHALDINAKSWLSARNLSFLLSKRGQIAESLRYASLAAQWRPLYKAASPDSDSDADSNVDIGALQDAVRQNPGDADAHYVLGQALGKQGRVSDAIDEFHAALRINPNDSRVHADLGVALCMAGQTDAGVTEMRTAISLQPDSPDTHYDLGAILDQQGHTQEAVSEFQLAVSERPDYTEAQNALAKAQMRLRSEQ
jgi:hypothetical protein